MLGVLQMSLYKRILDISLKGDLSHLSSCLTAVDLIDKVYEIKNPGDIVVLSSGHAGLALYCVIEKYDKLDAEKIFKHHGTHPDRCVECHIDCSSGSLGHGLGIALGMAIADCNRLVFCITSDGEWAEGSMWESLRIAADNRINNLIIFVNANGFSALKEVDRDRLEWQIAGFVKDKIPQVAFYKTENPPGLEGYEGHYKKLDNNLYKKLIDYYEKKIL
jgi:transketolase